MASVVNIVNYGYEKYYKKLKNQVSNFEQEQPFVTIGISQLSQTRILNQKLEKSKFNKGLMLKSQNRDRRFMKNKLTND